MTRIRKPLLNAMLALDTKDALLVRKLNVAPLVSTRGRNGSDFERVVIVQLEGRINKTQRVFRGSLALTQNQTTDLVEQLLDSDADLRDELLARLAARHLIS